MLVLGTQKDNKDVLQKNLPNIVAVLQYNLLNVAGKLLELGVINSSEHWLVTNSQADHNKAAMLLLMDSIRKEIKRDKDKMIVFLKAVEDMGGPAEEIAQEMSKYNYILLL